MTTRNFRVNNGIEIGDVTIDASTNKITGLATSAPSADGDVVTKAYSDSGTQTMTNKTLTSPIINSPTLNGTITATQITVNDVVSNGSNADITLDAAGTGDINLTAGADVNVPANIGVTFGNDGEKIEGDGTDLTIASSAKLNLTATSDVHIPQNVGLVFDANGSEKIESNDTDLTINSGAKIKLTATSDVEIPNDVGIAYGTGGEKIESDGTDLTITSTGVLNLTATGNTAITNNATIGGNLTLTGDLTVNGSTTTVNTTNTTVSDNLMELNSGISSSSNDIGFIFERGSTGDNAAIIWDESADKFKVGTTSATAGDKSGGITVTTGTLIANIEGNVTGDVTGNADTATEATNVTVTANNTANEDIFICLVDGASGTQGIETDTGLKYNPSTNVIASTASAAQYADVAERFEADAPMETGSVVMVGGSAEITEITSEMSEDVFGVISHKPAYMMNYGAGPDDTHPFVAMTGRTPVRVIGAVTKGQRLVTSSTKGCARAVVQGESISPFNVIGRALETSTDAGVKLINCAVRSNN